MTWTPKNAARAKAQGEWNTAGTSEATGGPDDLEPPGRGDSTDASLTPPHGDPERRHLDRDAENRDDDEVTDDEGPGLAEGHTDNKAGG